MQGKSANGGGKSVKMDSEKEDECLDRLLLLQSNLCCVLHQIDEVVAQAFQVNTVTKEGAKEIESLSLHLSNMLSSLRAWVPRLEKLLSHSHHSSPLVSPSPLVSWRPHCSIDRGGRQMFMLTPLPPSNHPKPHTSVLTVITPRLKISPPRSCVLLQPHSATTHASQSQSQAFAFKYPELLGLGIHHNHNHNHNHTSKPLIGNKTLAASASPDWLRSPPKTCVLLDPPDHDSCIHIAHVSKHHIQTQTSCNQDHIQSTPISFPGENTLKRELWTKFEAASTCGFQPKLPTVPENTRKGFLDLLEEASSDESF